MSPRAPYAFLAVSAVSMLILAGTAQALTDNWTTGSGNLWQVGPWSLGHPPAVTDAAVFNAFGIYTVEFNAATLDPTINDLHLLSGILNFATTAGPMRTLHVTNPSGPRKLTVNNASVRLGAGGAIKFDIGDAVSVTNGSLTVQDGSQLDTAGNIAIGTSAGSSGSIDVLGTGSSLTQTGANTITIGSNTTGTPTLNIGYSTNDGTLTTGTGLFTINKTGTVRVGNGGSNFGTLNANGDILIDGGQLIIESGSSLSLAADKTITIQNGGSASIPSLNNLGAGDVIFASGSLSYDGSLTVGSGGLFGDGSVTLTNDHQLTLGGIAIVAGESTNFTLGGGTLNTSGIVVHNGVFNFQSGTLGAASLRVECDAPFQTFPFALANFDNNVAATFNSGLYVGSNASDVFVGLNQAVVQSGADLIVGGISVFSTEHSAILTIIDAGSTVTLNPTTNLSISGDDANFPGQVNVISGGALTVGSGGSTDLLPNGILNIDGGIVDVKTLNLLGGTLNFNSGSLSCQGDLTIGTGGLFGNSLTLASDRHLTLSGTTTVDFSRTLALDGGTLNTGSLVLSGTLNFNSGTLGITGAGGVTINTGGALAGNGNVPANVQNDGLVSPGTSPGTLTITGNYTQGATGTLLIELASLASFDKLVVTGTANFAGTLDIDLIGFAPAAGNSFDILDFATRNGSFTLDLPLLPGSLQWNTSLLYTTGVLSVVSPSVPGDYNSDGKVDAADYVVWRKTDGTPAGYNTWRANFGQPSGSGSVASANATVPEPTTSVLLIVAAVGIRLCGRHIDVRVPSTR